MGSPGAVSYTDGVPVEDLKQVLQNNGWSADLLREFFADDPRVGLPETPREGAHTEEFVVSSGPVFCFETGVSPRAVTLRNR